MKNLYFLITYLSISSTAPSLEAKPSDHRRIVGGDEANIKDFRYMGAMLENGEHFCGAALINNNTVVTAAHCVQGLNITKLSVRLGSSQWRSGGQKISVKRVTIHENFFTFAPDYDIAVVKLNESVNVANAVPIDLAKQGSPTGTSGVVSGWGMTSTDEGSKSETLRKVEVPVYNQTQCRDAHLGGVTDRMICAGYKEGGKNAYFFDSGGPYVINGELVGIVAFGSKFPSDATPTVYTFVPAYNDWIYLHA